MKIKPRGYWTKERCHEEALKYNTKTEYSKNSSYQQAISNGWIDEICSHMKKFGSKYKRCIYVYEFLDNSVYVGLTCNIDRRNIQHLLNKNSPVFKKIQEGIQYEHKILTDYIDVEESKEMEKYYVEEYNKNNWIILNKSKTGGVGGKFIKWTKERCYEEALKYNNRSEFEKNNGSAYHVIIKNKWNDEMFSHMTLLQRPNGYWTKEKCREEALKYNTRSELKENNSAVYTIILRRGWRNDLFSHMNTVVRKQSKYWTKERCLEEALKYNTRNEFKKNSTSYQRARHNGWLNEICLHMK